MELLVVNAYRRATNEKYSHFVPSNYLYTLGLFTSADKAEAAIAAVEDEMEGEGPVETRPVYRIEPYIADEIYY